MNNMEPEKNPFSLGTPEVPGYKIVGVSTAEPEKKDVWAEFDEATKCYDIASSVRPLLRAVILNYFIPRAEVVEMVKGMPYSHTKEGGVYISRDDLLDLLTQ